MGNGEPTFGFQQDFDIKEINEDPELESLAAKAGIGVEPFKRVMRKADGDYQRRQGYELGYHTMGYGSYDDVSSAMATLLWGEQVLVTGLVSLDFARKTNIKQSDHGYSPGVMLQTAETGVAFSFAPLRPNAFQLRYKPERLRTGLHTDEESIYQRVKPKDLTAIIFDKKLSKEHPSDYFIRLFEGYVRSETNKDNHAKALQLFFPLQVLEILKPELPTEVTERVVRLSRELEALKDSRDWTYDFTFPHFAEAAAISVKLMRLIHPFLLRSAYLENVRTFEDFFIKLGKTHEIPVFAGMDQMVWPVKMASGEETAEEERSFVTLVEELPIDEFFKAEILLVYIGKKPATEVTIPRVPSTLSLKEKLTYDNFLFDALKRGGLYVGTPFKRSVKEESTYFISRDKDLLTRGNIYNVRKNISDKEIGWILGYPLSAVDAYCDVEGNESGNARVIQVEDLPNDVAREDSMAFLDFALSKDNWKKELETVKEWANAVKQASPVIYRAIVEEYRKTLH